MSGEIVIPAHVQIDDLQSTLDNRFETLTQRPSDSAMAFCISVMGWTIKWARKHGATALADVAPFAIIDADAGNHSSQGWTLMPFFREAMPIALGGKLLATSTPMYEVLEADTGLTDLIELGQRIMSSNLATRPMLVVEPSSGRMFVCPAGVNSDRLTLHIEFNVVTQLDPHLVDRALDDFHRDYTAYPDGYAHVWHHRPSRTLLRDAEAIVRDHLFLYFKSATFHSGFVLREEALSVGRADISIHDSGPGKVALCVFELKALRSRGMPKVAGKGPTEYNSRAMDLHVRRGVRQVNKYRSATKSGLAYVCMYDGRDASIPLDLAEALANSLGVNMRLFFMETKTQDDLDD